jgi:arginyl-tRNA synthetase
MNILAELQSRFARVLADYTTPDRVAEYAAMVRPAQDAKFGDYQANCAMPLAKQAGLNPRELATQIISKLDLSDLCHPAEIAGPGFINLKVRDEVLQKIVNDADRDPRLGVETVAAPKSIVVDFSGPNVAKPMHVGHLRSTVIGAAIDRTLRFLGHNVVSDNHLGDWGTQFGMILYGYKNFLDPEAYKKNAVEELARLYRLVNTVSDYLTAKASLPQLAADLNAAKDRVAAAEAANSKDKAAQAALKKLRTELTAATEELKSAEKKVAAGDADPVLKDLAAKHPNIARAARDETAKLHAGDAENRRLWNEFLPACINALNRIYDRLGISFDKTLGESFYDPFLEDVVKQLKAKGLARESDGAQCVFLEGRAAPFIVQKADGAFTYATTDLATINYRLREWKADVILYVVDDRQSDHFEMLFETARLMGNTEVDLRHTKFGTVMGEDGKPFKTRAGDTVGLESLLDEAIREARKIVDENDDSKRDDKEQPAPELDEATRAAVAEAVGLGGIKYADLHHNRESDYVFSWSKMLAKTGDTATYMQYAYARTRGILRRAEAAGVTLGDAPIRLALPAERQLGIHIARFPEAIAAMVNDYRPNLLTSYLFELANGFSSFYDACPVMKEPDAAIRASRLKLVDLTGRIIQKGLDLLGITTCERM